MKIFKFFILSAVAATLINASEPIQAQDDLNAAKQNILAGTVGGKKSPVVGVSQEIVNPNVDTGEQDTTPTSSKKNSSKKKVVPSYSYHDEKILNWINETNSMISKDNSMQSSIRSVAFRGSLSEHNATVLASYTLNPSIKSIYKTFSLSGVCTIPEEVTLSGIAKGVLMAFCQTPKGKYKLFGELTPKPEEYALMAKPIYVEDVYGKRFYVDNNNSYVLNSKKNSYNIATFVNTYALNKVIRESIKNSATDISTTATQYMQDLKASRTSTSTMLVPNTGVQVASNTTAPVASDYVTILGIQMSADLVSRWADYALQDQAWGYKIIEQTKIYMDLKLIKKGEDR